MLFIIPHILPFMPTLSEGYKYYHRRTRKLYISVDVIFVENKPYTNSCLLEELYTLKHNE